MTLSEWLLDDGPTRVWMVEGWPKCVGDRTSLGDRCPCGQRFRERLDVIRHLEAAKASAVERLWHYSLAVKREA